MQELKRKDGVRDRGMMDVAAGLAKEMDEAVSLYVRGGGDDNGGGGGGGVDGRGSSMGVVVVVVAAAMVVTTVTMEVVWLVL